MGDRARPEMADGEDAPLSGRHVERGVASESALPDLDERVDDEPSPLRMILWHSLVFLARRSPCGLGLRAHLRSVVSAKVSSPVSIKSIHPGHTADSFVAMVVSSHDRRSTGAAKKHPVADPKEPQKRRQRQRQRPTRPNQRRGVGQSVGQRHLGRTKKRESPGIRGSQVK